MIIIGEKINGAIPSTAEAIRAKDEGSIIHLIEINVVAHRLEACYKNRI